MNCEVIDCPNDAETEMIKDDHGLHAVCVCADHAAILADRGWEEC